MIKNIPGISELTGATVLDLFERRRVAFMGFEGQIVDTIVWGYHELFMYDYEYTCPNCTETHHLTVIGMSCDMAITHLPEVDALTTIAGHDSDTAARYILEHYDDHLAPHWQAQGGKLPQIWPKLDRALLEKYEMLNLSKVAVRKNS